jgi:hypothetical protein
MNAEQKQDIMNIERKELNGFFRNFPKNKIPLTLLEIGGKSHLEDPINNYMAFFFDKNQIHGLGDMFIQSLLKLYGHEYSSSERLEVFREVVTDKGRIDILIVLDNEVIIIEGKVYHNLKTNPLDDYVAYTKHKYPDKEPIKVVLSLYKETMRDDFKNITFQQLFDEVLLNLGTYATTANSFYTAFLIDFYNTLKKLRMGKISEETLSYIQNNKEKFIAVHSTLDTFYREIKNKSNSVNEELKKRDIPIDFSNTWTNRKELKEVTSWNFKKDIILSKDPYLKTRISVEGWEVEIWTKDLANEFFNQILDLGTGFESEENSSSQEHFIRLGVYPYHTRDVSEKIEVLMRKISKIK